MKKLVYLLLFVLCITLVSCGEDKPREDTKDADYVVGILQYLTHDALDDATKGFKDTLEQKLKEQGKTVKFVYKNPEQDETMLTSMAAQLVQECDLVLGNATPAATALKSAAKRQGKDLPILFTSVTDPVSVSLVESLDKPNTNSTGTSDMNPVEAQIDLIFEVKPETKKIGFLYTSTETNSIVQCDMAKEYLKKNKGFTDDMMLTRAFNQASDIAASVTYLVNNGVDCIYLPTDNTVASSISTITKITNPNGVFLLAGEGAMIKNGATFSYSINYYSLGQITGQMAFEILNGADIKTMAVRSQTTDFEFSYNEEALEALNLNLSEEFKNKHNIK